MRRQWKKTKAYLWNKRNEREFLCLTLEKMNSFFERLVNQIKFK